MEKKDDYSSPTVYNNTDMKLSGSSQKDGLAPKTPLKGAFMPSIALSASLALVLGVKNVGERGVALTKKKDEEKK